MSILYLLKFQIVFVPLKTLGHIVHGYEPRKVVNLLSMSPHSKIFDLFESFACTIHNLQVGIIKHIQVSNKQYNFQTDLHKSHDV